MHTPSSDSSACRKSGYVYPAACTIGNGQVRTPLDDRYIMTLIGRQSRHIAQAGATWTHKLLMPLVSGKVAMIRLHKPCAVCKSSGCETERGTLQPAVPLQLCEIWTQQRVELTQYGSPLARARRSASLKKA